MDNRALYYNADLLRQGGFVDEQGNPQPPDTWEQVLTKRVDVSDARIAGCQIALGDTQTKGYRIHSLSAGFVTTGVRAGDTLSHVSDRGQVTRCLVHGVEGPHDLTVRSAYTRKELVLPENGGQHVKVFDQDGYALRLSRWDDEGRIKRVGFEPQHGNSWLYIYG